MIITNPLHLRDNVIIDIYHHGQFVRRQTAHNLVTLVGQNMVRDAWFSGLVVVPDRFALGDDATAPVSTDTELGNEVFRSVFSTKTIGVASITYRYFLTPGQANGFFLREAGLVHNTSNALYARVTFTEIEKNPATTVFFSWTISIEVP